LSMVFLRFMKVRESHNKRLRIWMSQVRILVGAP
jgi:hypothetical protein